MKASVRNRSGSFFAHSLLAGSKKEEKKQREPAWPRRLKVERILRA